MTDLKDLELKPFKTADVPADLAWCVYPEERERGEVLLPKTAYMVVLALRWILTYTDIGLDDDFETWRVYWAFDEDERGLRTRLVLCRDMVEQWDSYHGNLCLLQEHTWSELAILLSRNDREVINEVCLPDTSPYGGRSYFNGVTGVRRLLEDAVAASRATLDTRVKLRDGWSSTSRYDGMRAGDGCTLRFKLECDDAFVRGISLKVEKRLWR